MNPEEERAAGSPENPQHVTVLHQGSDCKPVGKVYEDRPGWATCFPPKNPNSKAAFTGVTVLDGRKFWLAIYEKETRYGRKYLSVHLEAWRSSPQEKGGANG